MSSQSSKRPPTSSKGTLRSLSTRGIAVSFVVLSLLAQSFGFVGGGAGHFGAFIVQAAEQPTAGQLSQPIQADPESPAATKQRQIREADKVKSVPVAKEFSGRLPQTNPRSAAGVQTPAQGQPAPLPDGTALDGVRKQLNFKPSNAPQITPHISVAFTYYANYKFDGPINNATCIDPGNSNCSLRDAITLAGSDGHSTTPDLIVLQPLTTIGPPYFVTFASLPNIPDNVYLSVNTTLTCPLNDPEMAEIEPINLPITNTTPLLTLGSNDYLNAIVISGSHGRGLQINGSANRVSCVDVEYSKASGIVIEGSASNNQIGGINPAASVKGFSEVLVQNNKVAANAGFLAAGILITGTNAISNTIQGATVISNDVGISLEGAANHNNVGGSMIYGNTFSGIQLLGGSNNNLLGGLSTDATQRNLISGNGLSTNITNSSSGVLISGSATANNTVSGNYIGTNISGTTALGNGAAGVEMLDADSSNTIGGSAAGQGNLVSGNGYGVMMLSASNNNVVGNLVGTDLNGTAAIPNTLDGISISANPIGLNPGPSNSNIITGNVVGGNGFGGISLIDAASLATGNVVQNNLIGVKADKSGALYNGSSQGDGTGQTVCYPQTTPPDILSEDCNGVLIASLDAINIAGLGSGPTGNIIRNNAIAADNGYAQNSGTALGPNGVLIDYANANTVQGNTIGVVFNGSAAVPITTNVGIFLLDGASNNRIGGDSTAGEGNLIANSRFNSMQMYEQYFSAGSPTFGPMTGNRVQGNAIGVDFNGTDQPNLRPVSGLGGVFGIDIEASIVTQTFSSNLIGVDYSVANPNLNQGNLIGNHTIAINLARTNNGGASADSNQINGNKLGVSATTSSSNAGNALAINISGSLSNTTVRGNFLGASNLTPVTNVYGIIAVGPITGTNITRNYIGTNAVGADLHIGTAIFLGSVSGNGGGANQTSINQNVIAYNQVEGILVGNSSADNQTQRNTISQNSLYFNAGKGINLNYAGAAPNGVFGGSDTGPNNQAQAPTISGAFYYLNSTTFKVFGTANPNSTVEVFLGNSASVTTTQGVTYLGAGNADASGNFAVITSYAGTVSDGSVLVATSTLKDLAFPQRLGSTSQFSAAASVIAPPPQLLVAPTNLNFTAPAGGSQPAAQTVTLTATNGPLSYTTGISYGAGANNWLTATPASATIISGTNQTVTLTTNTTGLVAGTYTATVTFQDVNNPTDLATVNVTLTITTALPVPQLAVTPASLNFTSQVGSQPASQTVTLTASNGPITYTTSYTGALTVTASPASGTLASGGNGAVTILVNATGLVAGTYTATVTFQDVNNLADKAVVNVTLTVTAGPPPPPTTYTYYLPFLANNYNPGGTITGTFSSYLAVQNAGDGPATATINYFDSTGVTLTASTVVTTVARYGEVLPANPLANSTRGAGVITSNQPLNVIVAEGTPFGGSAYAVNQGANSQLVAPIAINNNNNFVTQITVFNGGTVTTTATLTYYDQNGTSPANQNLTIGPHQGVIADQTNAGLPPGFYGWAAITSPVGSQLVAQVLEQRPDIKFVAIANAQPAPQTTLYAPAIFNNAYGGFFTGANIVNPNSTPVTVSISYYDLAGIRFTAAPFVLVGRGVQGVFQGGAAGNGIPAGGLPANFVGAAVITATNGGVNIVVNEFKQVATGSQSGVYAAASGGSGSLGLPVIARNGFGYTTGTTVFNASPNPATFILAYYNLDGTTLTNPAPRAITVAAYASVGIYQGDDLSNLSGGFYGTAVLTQTSRGSTLIDTTNAINSSAGLFYTYTEPAQ